MRLATEEASRPCAGRRGGGASEPPLHLVDYGRFVRAWKKEGTQRMGIFKGAETGMADDPNSASQVVRRHLSATSPSPLYQ